MHPQITALALLLVACEPSSDPTKPDGTEDAEPTCDGESQTVCRAVSYTHLTLPTIHLV